jgi:alpha-2-macroglobulin
MRLIRLLAFFVTLAGVQLSALELFINRAYTTTEKARATIYAHHEGSVFMRIYRVDDVHAYLSGQSNAHTVSEKNERIMQPGYFLWRSLIENLEYALYQVARHYMRADYRERLRKDLGLEKYAYPFRDRFPEANLFTPLQYPVVSEVVLKKSTRNWQVMHHDFEHLKAGYYLIEVSQGRSIAHSPLVISDVALLTKTSPHEVLIYAVNILTGEPLASGFISAYTRQKDKHHFKKNLELKNGIAYTSDVGFLESSQNTLYMLNSAGHLAFSDLYAVDLHQKIYESAIYTDRPVYRIGDKVHVRAVFVRRQGAAAHGKVRYEVTNNHSEKIYSGEGKLSKSGGIAFDLKTQDLKPGRFSVVMEIENEKHTGNFLIEQYKKPETKAAITSEKTTLLSGEAGTVKLVATYYSGEPLAKAKVGITIERSRISYPWWYGLGFDEYYAGDYEYHSWEYVKEFSGELDAKGTLSIPVATDSKAEYDYTYRVRARVHAANREETQASARIKVYRAPVSIRLAQERWFFSAKNPIQFQIHTQSVFDQKPVSATLVAILYRRTYDSKQHKYIDTKVSEISLKTPQTGEIAAEFPATAQAGTYLVRVNLESGGRHTHEYLETYVFGGRYADADNYEAQERSITITANRKKYDLLDTAEFAVRLPVEKKIPVLLTIENDRIRKYTLVAPTEGSFIHREELLSELSPNFEITVTAFDYDKYPRIYSGSTQVVIPPKHRILNMQVVADRSRYRPGEEANLIVRTTDQKNNPVSAEFSLGVVDEAIYAIREDTIRTLPLELNPRIPHSVVTNNSLVFSFYGYGQEKGLYALYKEQSAEAAALMKGQRQKVRIRKNFKDTAYFRAFGQTDKSGVAKLTVPLPDNLTEWRITAHAVSTSGLSGTHRTGLIVAKDFALRLAQPRFLRERDEAKLRLLVSNQLKESQTAVFDTQFSELKIQGAFPKSLTIPAGEERFVDFTVTAPFYPKDGQANLKFIARSEKDSDGLQLGLPILPYGVENYVAAQKLYADKETTWHTTLQLDKDARTEHAQMIVSYIPGILPSVVETLPYLIRYPYGCVEQTLSTFLPAVWASRAAKELRLPLPVKSSELTKITEAGLNKLYGYQHSDGGWGWWSEDPTDIYMTAYVLDGLREASLAKLAINKNVMAVGMRKLGEQLTVSHLTDMKESYSRHRWLYAQKVYVVVNPKSPLTKTIHDEWIAFLAGGFAEPTGLALMLQGANAAGFTDIRNKALEKLVAIRKSNREGTYFETSGNHNYYWYNDRDETTAQVLMALIETTRKPKELAERGLISYLIARKTHSRWRSTKVSALVTKAFSAYAMRTGEKLTATRVIAEVDGERRDATFDPKNFTSADMQIAFKTTSRAAKVKIRRTGSGFFLARAEWRHYLNKPLIAPREGDFKMTRRFYAVDKSGNTFNKGAPGYVFKPGQVVMTELSLTASKGSEYLLVEDMIPAGFEPLSTAELNELGRLRYDNYAGVPSATTRLDDRVGLAKTYMSKELFAPRAFYRAVFPGKYQTMPVQGGLMYYPETFAYSSSDVITITD